MKNAQEISTPNAVINYVENHSQADRLFFAYMSLDGVIGIYSFGSHIVRIAHDEIAARFNEIEAAMAKQLAA